MVMTRREALCLIPAATLAAQPRRIVSTAPSITELLYALGLGDNVVGVTRFCRYPPEAQSKPKIGDYTSPNLEAIAALCQEFDLLCIADEVYEHFVLADGDHISIGSFPDMRARTIFPR